MGGDVLHHLPGLAGPVAVLAAAPRADAVQHLVTVLGCAVHVAGVARVKDVALNGIPRVIAEKADAVAQHVQGALVRRAGAAPQSWYCRPATARRKARCPARRAKRPARRGWRSSCRRLPAPSNQSGSRRCGRSAPNKVSNPRCIFRTIGRSLARSQPQPEPLVI